MKTSESYGKELSAAFGLAQAEMGGVDKATNKIFLGLGFKGANGKLSLYADLDGC